MPRDAGVMDAGVAEAARADAGSAPVASETPRSQYSCDVANQVLTSSSRFEDALRAWAKPPVGSSAARALMVEACDHANDEPFRGIESAACAFVGLLSMSADGVRRDPAKAFDSFRRADKSSFDFGAYDHVATLELTSVFSGASRDRFVPMCPSGCEAHCERAVDAVAAAVTPPLESICTSGHATACTFLADLEEGEYIAGVGRVQIVRGATEDDARTRADAWLARACKGSEGSACKAQAYRLPGDQGSPAALALLKRSCALGWGDACFAVGEQVSDHASALAYWDRACKLGLQKVCDDVVTIRKSGTFPDLR